MVGTGQKERGMANRSVVLWAGRSMWARMPMGTRQTSLIISSQSCGVSVCLFAVHGCTAGVECEHMCRWSRFLLMNTGKLARCIHCELPLHPAAPRQALLHFTIMLLSNPSNMCPPPAALLEAIKQCIFIMYSVIYAAGTVIFTGLSERGEWVDIGLCLLFGGFTVLATKGMSVLLMMEYIEIFAEWITYPILAVRPPAPCAFFAASC
ncbi:hypothetical protein HETIRDRAFT_412913 [Heterobasidion irregulare TC 32-1]|uniref:Uncharacterized protein n=1 Tax=Heterobasidion irregulare (strain TC 32-1) TaxID=747525 RepID=W4KN43_HETIT|nr:uncharacterized protein HETIRDRAFT_412913 [Heterobasidion irregulare TC 32-1]ETW86466.1 hypothetical protein HETIRDRAFT_412913 [Heterobasidion irregulare TC 32-1]